MAKQGNANSVEGEMKNNKRKKKNPVAYSTKSQKINLLNARRRKIKGKEKLSSHKMLEKTGIEQYESRMNEKKNYGKC